MVVIAIAVCLAMYILRKRKKQVVMKSKEPVFKDVNGVKVELPSETRRPQELGTDCRIPELEASNGVMI